MGDTVLWLALASVSDFFHIPDETTVYRRHVGGISSTRRANVIVDGIVARAYFAKLLFSIPIEQSFKCQSHDYRSVIVENALTLNSLEQREMARKLFSVAYKKKAFGGVCWRIVACFMAYGFLTSGIYLAVYRCCHFLPLFCRKMHLMNRDVV